MAQSFRWSGRTWTKRSNHGDPGPNAWSPNGVTVDANGWVHLRLLDIGGVWHSAEMQGIETLGYGEYAWDVIGPSHLIDTHTVAGLFTYEFTTVQTANEIDFEFAQAFDGPGDAWLYTTVQPYNLPGHGDTHRPPLTNDLHTHQFLWQERSIHWRSWYGHRAEPPSPGSLIHEYTYASSDVPFTDGEHVFLNLWSFLGNPPVDTNQVELVVREFTFTPLEDIDMAFADEFNDGTRHPRWVQFGDAGALGVTETGGRLCANPPNNDYYSTGYRTGYRMVRGASTSLFSAVLADATITTKRSTPGPDLVGILSVYSGLKILDDPFWATNAVTVLTGYDVDEDSLDVELFTKAGSPATFGTPRYRARLNHLAEYLATAGIEVRLELGPTGYSVSAFFLGAPLPLDVLSGASSGLHGLGTSLEGVYVTVGTQNGANGRGALYWDRATATASIPGLGAAPLVRIDHPRSGAEYVAGEAISFRGSGSGQGAATVTSLVWHSMADGFLGQGTSVINTLSTAAPATVHLAAGDDQGGGASATVPLTVWADGDSNGLADAWEMIYWPTGGSGGAGMDSDKDGMLNGEEWAAGTDPTNKLSFLRIHLIERSGGDAVLEWQGRSNRCYRVEMARPLSSSDFGPVGPLFSPLSDQVQTATHPLDPEQESQFRLELRR